MAVPRVQEVCLVVSLDGESECFSPVTEINGYPWRLHLVKKNNRKCSLFVLCEMSSEFEYWETSAYFKLKHPLSCHKFNFGSMVQSQKKLIGEYPLFADGTRLEVVAEVHNPGDQWVPRPILGLFAPRDGCLVIEGKRIYVDKQSLASQSSFFDKLFNGDFKEKNMAEIPIKDVKHEEFMMLLRMLYGENGTSAVAKLLTDENFNRVIDLIDRFDLKAILLGIGNALASWNSSLFTIHDRLRVADYNDGYPKSCTEKILELYDDDELMELRYLLEDDSDYEDISAEVRHSAFAKTCDALKEAKRKIAQYQLEKSQSISR